MIQLWAGFAPFIVHAGPQGEQRYSSTLFQDLRNQKGWGKLHAPAASTLGKDPVPIVQEAGWTSGPVWPSGNSLLHRDSIPDRPARSQSLYQLSYPVHILQLYSCYFSVIKHHKIRVLTNRRKAAYTFLTTVLDKVSLQLQFLAALTWRNRPVMSLTIRNFLTRKKNPVL